MSAQFIHLDTFGRTSRTTSKRHACAVGILNEAARAENATCHIPAPEPAQLLLGAKPTDLIAELRHLFKEARDSRGRKLRSDAGYLVAMVISYPAPRVELHSDEATALYEQWEAQTIDWLKVTFPTTIRSVVRHCDETHLHLHAFLLPPLKRDGQLCWLECHPGLAARQASSFRGDRKATQNFHYIAAMRQLQDDFFAFVSCKFNHTRSGPLRERRQREEHLKLTALEKDLAKSRIIIEQLQAELAQVARDPAPGSQFTEHRDEHQSASAYGASIPHMSLSDAPSQTDAMVPGQRENVELRSKLCGTGATFAQCDADATSHAIASPDEGEPLEEQWAHDAETENTKDGEEDWIDSPCDLSSSDDENLDDDDDAVSNDEIDAEFPDEA